MVIRALVPQCQGVMVGTSFSRHRAHVCRRSREFGSSWAAATRTIHLDSVSLLSEACGPPLQGVATYIPACHYRAAAPPPGCCRPVCEAVPRPHSCRCTRGYTVCVLHCRRFFSDLTPAQGLEQWTTLSLHIYIICRFTFGTVW